MNQPTRPPANCPERESISCAIDGEAPADVVEHITDCASCTTIADGYRTVDGLTSKVLNPPEHLAARVKGACRTVTPVAREPIVGGFLFFRSSPARYAAALAITCTLVGLLAVAVSRLNRPNEIATGAGGNPGGDSYREYPTPAPSEQPLRKVDAGAGRSAPSGMIPVNRTGEGFDSLPRQVEHVWTVADVEASKDLIVEKLLPEGTAFAAREENGNLVLSVSLRDRDVQGLVDAMQLHGMELVSPSLPQPGAQERIRFLGVNVSYEGVLVKAKL